MKILRTDNSQNIILNTETDFQTDLGWEDNMSQFEEEILNEIINPAENYDTVRYIHKSYSLNLTGSTSGATQTDLWFSFYFLQNNQIFIDYLIKLLNKSYAYCLKKIGKKVLWKWLYYVENVV